MAVLVDVQVIFGGIQCTLFCLFVESRSFDVVCDVEMSKLLDFFLGRNHSIVDRVGVAGSESWFGLRKFRTEIGDFFVGKVGFVGVLNFDGFMAGVAR